MALTVPLRRAKHLRWQPFAIAAAVIRIYRIAPMSHRHNIYTSFDFEITSATTKWAAAVAEGRIGRHVCAPTAVRFQARGSVRFGMPSGGHPQR